MHRNLVALAFCLFCVTLVVSGGRHTERVSAEPDSSATPRAEEIYLHSLAAMRGLPQPKYVIFRADYWARNAAVSCTSSDGLDVSLRHGDSFSAFRVWYRVADRTSVTVDPKTHSRCEDGMIEPAGAQIEMLGQGTPKPTPMAIATENPNGLRLIGTVRVESVHFYRVTLVGTEIVDGHQTYHLALHAYRNPLDHPLTDVWVDTASSLIRRLQAEVSVHLLIASARGSFVASFDRYGPYWLLDNEHVELAANATLVHLRSTINIRASDLSFPADLAGVFPSPEPSPTRR